MRQLPKLQVVIALLRDGFHPASPGGAVTLAGDGTPVLDYPLTPYIWEGARRALRIMAEIQFAAGATRVMPIHGDGTGYRDWNAARTAIDGFTLAPLVTPVVSAHVMGGCPFGADPRSSVVDPSGRHHQLANLYVVDGSLLPTSVGANPQLSIYAIATRQHMSSAVSRASPPAAGAAAPPFRDRSRYRSRKTRSADSDHWPCFNGRASSAMATSSITGISGPTNVGPTLSPETSGISRRLHLENRDDRRDPRGRRTHPRSGSRPRRHPRNPVSFPDFRQIPSESICRNILGRPTLYALHLVALSSENSRKI
jgi:hypothetical protein